MTNKPLKENKVAIKNNKSYSWNKWWSSFENTNLQRLQCKQERKDIFESYEKEKLNTINKKCKITCIIYLVNYKEK